MFSDLLSEELKKTKNVTEKRHHLEMLYMCVHACICVFYGQAKRTKKTEMNYMTLNSRPYCRKYSLS